MQSVRIQPLREGFLAVDIVCHCGKQAMKNANSGELGWKHPIQLGMDVEPTAIVCECGQTYDIVSQSDHIHVNTGEKLALTTTTVGKATITPVPGDGTFFIVREADGGGNEYLHKDGTWHPKTSKEDDPGEYAGIYASEQEAIIVLKRAIWAPENS